MKNNILDEFYDYFLHHKSDISTKNEIVFSILADFTDRRGLRQEWEQIDNDIKCEIINTWIEMTDRIICKNLK